jgi:hypothetical protein
MASDAARERADEDYPAICARCVAGRCIEALTIVNSYQPNCWICGAAFGPFNNIYGQRVAYAGSVVRRSLAERFAREADARMEDGHA